MSFLTTSNFLIFIKIISKGCNEGYLNDVVDEII